MMSCGFRSSGQVSIHAARAGGEVKDELAGDVEVLPIKHEFQSTPPARAAT